MSIDNEPPPADTAPAASGYEPPRLDFLGDVQEVQAGTFPFSA